MDRAKGITLIELLAALAIIGLLMGLLMPAIQAAREAARGVACTSNLKQLGMAVELYHGSHGCFPPGMSYGKSWIVGVLPYLDQYAAYSSVRYTDFDGAEHLGPLKLAWQACPSDAAATESVSLNGIETYSTSYSGCNGSWALAGGGGVFTQIPATGGRAPWVGQEDILDGSSNTAAISEVLRADGSYQRLRVAWILPRTYGSEELREFRRACTGLPIDPQSAGYKGDPLVRGFPWWQGSLVITLYNHAFPPQSPPCFNGGHVPSAGASASSGHPGVVHVAMADGSTRKIRHEIDESIWFELGSISGESE